MQKHLKLCLSFEKVEGLVHGFWVMAGIIPEIVLKVIKIDGDDYRVVKKCFFMVPFGGVTEEVNTL